MADVRLTATNPEDSSVVPVACNAKGELLLEEPTIASDDYVAVTGDNMTGDLTLGIDKITLDASDGSATFASGACTIFNQGSIKATSLEATDNVFVEADAGAGALSVLNESTNLPEFQVVVGDATKIGYNVSTDPKITLDRSGSAEFAGDVVVGSRNKQWMLVEQNGLCHMVEQLRATTADLVAPAVAEYPPLRDVFAELDAIEKALGDVMDKLRMAPPAGWEVWDGSSENS